MAETLLDEVQPDKLLSRIKAGAGAANNPDAMMMADAQAETIPDPDRPPTGGAKAPPKEEHATITPEDQGGGGTEYDLAKGSRLRDLVAEDQYNQSGGGVKHPLLRRALAMGGALAPLAALPFIHSPGAAAGAAQGVAHGVNTVGGEFRHEDDVRREQHNTLLNKIQAEAQMENQRQMEENRTRATESGANLRARVAEEGMTARDKLQGERDERANQRLIETIKSREGIAGANRQEKGKEFEEGRTDKTAQFKSTDQYRRWKEQLDNQTKMRVAQLTQSKAPAAMMQTAEFAQGGINAIDDARAAMEELKASGVMGSLPANKVEDWIFGKGLVDPTLDPRTRQTIGKLRAATSLASSAMLRAHTGRTSLEIYRDMRQMMGVGQDWDALEGAFGEAQGMLGHYVEGASDANIRAIRGGGAGGGAAAGGGAGAGANPPASPAAPKLTNLHTNPTTRQVIGQDAQGRWVDQRTGQPYVPPRQPNEGMNPR